MATTLPRPEVKTVPDFSHQDGNMHVDIVVSRDNKAKSFHGAGSTQVEAVSDAVEKMLGDRATGEWLP